MGSNPMPAIILIVVLVGVFLVVRYGLNAAANKANDAISNKWSRYKNANPQGRELLADRYRGVANLGIELPPPGTPAPLPGTRGQAARARQVLVDPAPAAQKTAPQASRATAHGATAAPAAPAPAAPSAPKRAFCPKCGKELPPNAKFCGACGATVRRRTPQSA